jgi:CubicO group peptidase (beta-lactamase class C family)
MKSIQFVFLLSLIACTPDDLSTFDVPDEIALTSLSALDARITARMSNSRIPGLQAAIIKDGAVVWTGAYGLADALALTPVTDDTTFLVASISKTVTATALMQVWETGAFDLDENVSPYLGFPVRHPDYPNRAITFRQLLTHTSGIRDRWNALDPLYVQGDSPIPLGDFMEAYLTPSGSLYNRRNYTGQSGPGDRLVYSNIGMALTARLVETTTGVSFPDWCQDHIFEPLDMQETAWFMADLDESNVAHPHVGRTGRPQPVPHFGVPDYPDGMLRTSAGHLGRFLAMFVTGGSLDGEQVLETATVDLMKMPQVPGERQGLGWYGEDRGGTLFVGHNGGETGTSTEMFYRVSDGNGFVLLMNAEPTRWADVVEIERSLMQAADVLF